MLQPNETLPDEPRINFAPGDYPVSTLAEPLTWGRLHQHATGNPGMYHPTIRAVIAERAGNASLPEELEQPPDPVLAQLHEIVQEYPEVARNCEIIPIADAGYVVRIGEQSVSGRDWVFYDLDDTLIAYSETKQTRLDNLVHYAESMGLQLPSAELKHIMDVTDDFARWHEGDTNTYHIGAHVASLTWLTKNLAGVPASESVRAIQDLTARLAEIKATVGAQNEPRDEDPFHFEQNRLVLHDASDGMRSDNPVYSEVFNAMLRPRIYEDMLESLYDMATPVGEHAEAANTGIFTFGEPTFQLPKVLELMQTQAAKGRPLPISHIWLTTVPKGEFVRQLAEVSGVSSAGHALVANEVLQDDPHTVLLVDDSPKEVANFGDQGSVLHTMFGHAFNALHTVQSGTKNTPRSSPHRTVFDARRSQDYGNPTSYLYERLSESLRRVLVVARESGTVDDATIKRMHRRLTSYDEGVRLATGDDWRVRRDQEDRRNLGFSYGDVIQYLKTMGYEHPTPEDVAAYADAFRH